MRPRITMSHDALTMYIFHPMLARPIGMMKTNTRLRTLVKNQNHGEGDRRKAIQTDGREGKPVGPDRVVQDLGWV